MSPPGFTGGQYSLCRALLGASAAVWAACGIARVLARPDPDWPSLSALAVAGAGALLVAAGWHDRPAAAAALAAGVLLCHGDSSFRSPALLPPGWLLLAHLFVPRAPYGSLAARGRADPGGGWRLPRGVWIGTWIALVLSVILLAGSWEIPGGSAGSAGWSVGFVLLILFAFDPGWIAGRGRPAPETLFYDGGCGLCHRTVRFLLAEDPGGRRFRFATLQGAHFRAALAEERRRGLPDSLVLLTEDGRVLTRWRAVRHGLLRLGGYWSVLGWIGGVVPRVLGDAAYDLVARLRHRLFALPPDACPVTPPHLRARFILD